MKIDPPFELDPNVKVRTRFAPSPTGYLHVGGARTALYSWLFAKHNNGEFVLRIEDTDLERSTPEATAAIIEGMEWLNLAWEHGPYYQTKRFDRYNQVIDEMIPEGITVALGTDNICDYMVPLCEGDLWQELSLLAAGCRFPHLDAMVDIASINGRKVLGLEPV